MKGRGEVSKKKKKDNLKKFTTLMIGQVYKCNSSHINFFVNCESSVNRIVIKIPMMFIYG